MDTFIIILYRTKNKLKQHENLCKNYDYCFIEMPKGYNKISKYTFVVYPDLQALLIKNTRHNNP